MATIPQSPTTDFTATTLNGAINSSVGTITVNDASTIVVPTYAVIDREDNNGTATPTLREVVYISAKSGNDLTVTRNVDNSTARSHNDSALFEPMMTVGFWDDLYDALDNEHTMADGSHDMTKIAMLSGATIQTLANKVLSGTASVATLATASALISTGSITNLVATNAILNAATITTSIHASGASIVGFAAGGLNALFQVPGSLASQANVGGLVPVPVASTIQFMQGYVQTPASLASISATILKNNAVIGVVAILAGATFGSSASLSNNALAAGDELRLNINSTASQARDLSVLLRAL